MSRAIKKDDHPLNGFKGDPKGELKSDDALISSLKQDLKITPKTANTLIKAGYTNVDQIADASPDRIAQQFGEILRCPASHLTSYRRAFRRIVWVAAQENPRKHSEDCKNWSNKALMARGLWCSGFDDLTGREIDKKVKGVKRKPKA